MHWKLITLFTCKISYCSNIFVCSDKYLQVLQQLVVWFSNLTYCTSSHLSPCVIITHKNHFYYEIWNQLQPSILKQFYEICTYCSISSAYCNDSILYKGIWVNYIITNPRFWCKQKSRFWIALWNISLYIFYIKNIQKIKYY